MALRLKYAGDRRRARRWSATSGARWTPPWRAPPASRVYALPTYTALLELRDLLVAPRPREAVVGVTTSAVIWHDVENGSYDADLPLWRELAGAARRPGTGPRCRHRPRRARPGARRARGDGARRGCRAARRARAAGAERGAAVAPSSADARGFEPRPRFALVIAPMQFVQILGGAGRPRCDARPRAATSRPGGRSPRRSSICAT